MEGCGDFVGAGDGTEHAHGAAAAQANGDVDAEDAGKQAHPGEAMGGRIEQLLLERRLGDGGQLELSLEDKQRQLLGLGTQGLRGGDDASAQGVPGGEDAVVPNRVGTRRRNQGTQSGQEALGGHLGIGGAISAGLLEVDADLSVCGALDGIERKRGTEQIAADAFESVSVAAIQRDCGMQLHAEGGDEHWFHGTYGRVPAAPGSRAKPAEPELDAGRNAIFGGLTFVKHMLGEVSVQTLQCAQKVVPSQLLRRQEANLLRVVIGALVIRALVIRALVIRGLVIRGLEAAVGDQRVEVDEQP